MELKKTVPLPTVGAASLLVIFSVLCLTVFSLLSIATVQADTRLQSHTRTAVVDYYEADALAEQLLAQIRAGTVPHGVIQEGNRYTYRCPLSASQALEVIALVTGTDYEILRWQTVSTGEWTPDDRLPVWNGQ